MGYSSCPCDICLCPYFTEDAGLCTACENGDHRGYSEPERDE